MGKGTDSVAKSSAELEDEIQTIRGEMTDIVGELDTRRHEMLDVRVQIRRHPVRFAVAAGIVAGIAIGAIALARWRRSRERRPLEQLSHLLMALRRVVVHPEAVARADRRRGIPGRLAVALGTAGARLAFDYARQLLAARYAAAPRTPTPALTEGTSLSRTG